MSRKNKKLVDNTVQEAENLTTKDKFKRVLKSKPMKALYITLTACVLIVATVIVGCNLVASLKIKKMFDLQKEYVDLLADATQRIDNIDIYITPEELSNCTDELLFEKFGAISEETATMLATAGSTFEDWFNSELKAENVDLSYSDFISFSTYFEGRAHDTGATLIQLCAYYEDYFADMKTMCQLYKAATAIESVYTENYAGKYVSLTEHHQIETPLEFQSIIDNLVVSADTKAKLTTINNTIHRMVEVEYANRIADYKQFSPDMTNVYIPYFGDLTENTPETVLDNIKMLGCSEYQVRGGKHSFYIRTEDQKKAEEIQDKISESILDYANFFGIMNDELTEKDRFLAKVCGITPEKIEVLREKYTFKQSEYYEEKLLPLTDEDRAKFNTDFVFWNVLNGSLDFTVSPMVSYIDSADNYRSLAVIESGTYIFGDKMLESMLWGLALRDVYTIVFDRCDFEITEDSIDAPVTNDKIVAGMRNLYYAWLIKMSSYLQ